MIRAVVQTAMVLVLALACANFPGGAPASRDVAFDGPDDHLAFRLRHVGDEVRVEDGARKLLAVLTIEGREILANDPSGRAIARVTLPSPGQRGYRLFRAGSREHALELRGEPDGDFVVEDGRGQRIYKVKARDYGFKVERAGGAVESRIRIKDGKASVRNGAGETYLKTRDPFPGAGVVALTLEGIPFAEAAALATAIAIDSD